MSYDASEASVDILYALYEKMPDGTYEPVTKDDDLALEAEIRAADPFKQVAMAASPTTQSAILHAHVVETFFDFLSSHGTIDLAEGDDSRWDPWWKVWIEIDLGAARVYDILNSDTSRELRLNVWTRGCRTVEPAAAPSA